MSRPLRPLTFLARSAFRPHNLACARRGFQTSIPRHDEPASAQTVRIQRPKLRSWREIAVKISLGAILLIYVADFVLGDVEEEVDHGKTKTEGEAGEEGKEEGDEFEVPDELPKNAIFVPLWIPKENPPYYYKGSDPEWQGYQAFAKDRKKVKQVHDSVVEKAVHEVGNHKQLSKFLGPPLKTQRIWLDWTYPDRAPPDYETLGLEIADEYIALTSRPLSQRYYQRLQSTILPTSIAASMWASLRTFFQLQLARGKELANVKGNIGGQGHLPQPRPINFNDIVRPITETEPQNRNSQTGTPSEVKSSEGSSRESSPSNGKGSDAKASDKLSVLGSMDSIKTYLQFDLFGQEGAMAYAVFKKTLAQTWPNEVFVDRGQIYLSGSVEIIGSQGKVVLGVLALYNPRKSQLEGMALTVPKIQKRVSRPRGGP